MRFVITKESATHEFLVGEIVSAALPVDERDVAFSWTHYQELPMVNDDNQMFYVGFDQFEIFNESP